MEHMKELFYLREVIAQILENYPFRVKEKDLSVHKLWNARCSFFNVNEKEKLSTVRAQFTFFAFKFYFHVKKLCAHSLGLKASYKGIEQLFRLVSLLQIKLPQYVTGSKVSQSAPHS